MDDDLVDLKVGDRVERIGSTEPGGPRIGTKGIVCDPGEDQEFRSPLIPVRWIHWKDGWQGGWGKPWNGWAVSRLDLRKISKRR